MKKERYRVSLAFLISLALSFLFAFAVYHSMGFIYAIADDVIMRDIASGAFTGTPDGHLIFLRYALGFLISRLYMAAGGVDWYGFVLTGVIFLGLAAVLYRGLAAEKSMRWKLLYAGIALGMFGCVMVFHAAQFEWTICAAMTGASALYLYITEGDAGKGQKLFEGIFIWFLLLLTYWIRYDVFFMVLPGFGIAFLWKSVKREEKKFSFAPEKLILPAAVFLAVGLTAAAEQQAYEGEAWKEFERFQTARSQVYDYSGVPSYEENPAFFEELGLDEHDMRNLRHYALYLVDGMDADMMESLSAEGQRQMAQQAGLKARIKDGVMLAAEQIGSPEYFPVSIPVLIFVLGTILLAGASKKKILLPFLGFLGLEGAMWLGLGFMGRLPERVAFSMHLATLLGTAGFFLRLWEESGPEKPVLKKGVLLSGLVLSVGAGIFQWNASAESNREKLTRDYSYQIFKEVCKEKPENLYFIETYAAEPVGGAKVTAKRSEGLNNCLTLGDWYTTSPLDAERFQALGIEDVEETILKNPNAYLVVRDIEDPGFLGTYFSDRHPEYRLVCREVKEIEGRTYYLYQAEK